LFELADKGSSEVMSFAEFVHLDRMISMPHAEYLLAFRIADRDGDGFISKSKIFQSTTQSTNNLTKIDCDFQMNSLL
jgi:solute carrier family 25 (mitochondrial aspartate/glutamate transporter), member 12/13